MRFGIAIGAFVVSWLGVTLLRRVAETHSILDVPNERSLHLRPTPRGGGLVIAVLVVLFLQVSADMSDALGAAGAIALAGATLLVAVVSFYDDIRPLPMGLRLCAHTVAAVLTIQAIGLPSTIPAPFGAFIGVWLAGSMFMGLWIVGLTNVYNFMDGIDGMAGLQALIAGAGWVVLGRLTGIPAVELLGIVIAGASAGFLVHNWAPARVFMGDVGSATLGFTFAAMTALAASRDSRLLIGGALLLWPFLFDTVFTMCRRAARRDRLMTAHRSHLYQRLVISGYTHRAVSTTYGFLAALGLVCAAYTVRGGSVALVTSIAVVAASAVTLCKVVRWSEKSRSVALGSEKPDVSQLSVRTSP
jgi:UDP-N-acetylmuramyl pentapeptide phosphotransferase/UDP-N-acetylglucosamine-1-phosphate transferase